MNREKLIFLPDTVIAYLKHVLDLNRQRTSLVRRDVCQDIIWEERVPGIRVIEYLESVAEFLAFAHRLCVL